MDPIIKEKISEKLKLVPEKPGSYQMKNKDGIIIYVGKAKNLKRRVSSYFNRVQTGKTLMLVNDIYDFEYIVTNTELESLILEITLIKKYDPKYNILLRDDKSYPYIELTNDKYPTINIVRNLNRKKNRNKSKFFGPYPNVTAAKNTVELINRVYPLRKCKNLGKDLCLYYHIGECLGYCKYDIVDQEKVDSMKNEITSFLNGNKEIITKRLEEKMSKASEELNFEKALEYKNILDDINITLSKQRIDLNRRDSFDLVGFYNDDNYLSIQIFFIRDGLLFGHHQDIINVLDDIPDSVIEYIIKYYDKGNIIPREIFVSEEIDNELLESYLNTKVSVPKKGDIKNLLELAKNNAKDVLNEKVENIKKSDDRRLNAIEDLKKALNMDRIYRIETFDNSHLFGTFYVAGMVVFDNFLPNKNLYRKFKITSDVKDDLSAMKEVIYRRYYKVLMENLEKPDLIIVDGGELQINAAKEIIDSLGMNIRIVGLKKDDKHRTSTLIDEDLNEIKIDSHSDLFLFLTRIQDEVHNYAISYHRNIKTKGMFASVLEGAPKIGEVRKKELLRKYGSLKKLKEASLEELEEVLGKSVASEFYEYLRSIEDN